jgi:hypothetical protein
MAPTHHLVLRSPDGVKQAQLVGTADEGFISLAATRQVNAAGRLDFVMRADNPAIDYLENDSQVELWRNGALWFRTLYQEPRQYLVNAQNVELFSATCYGELDLLNRPVIAWAADVDNRTVFTEMKAESILHVLVNYNATTNATVENGRLVTFSGAAISVEADLGRGEFITRSDMAGKSLLTEMQEVALVGGIDFDLVYTGARAWTFRVFEGQRGIDRSGSVVFSTSRRNMAQMATGADAQDPRTVIIMGGQGEADKREFVVRYGPDYSTAMHREYFESFSGERFSTAAMQAAGDQIAEQRRIQPTLTFVPLQVAGTRYGIDYDLGDIVRGVYRDVDLTYQVTGVSLNATAGASESLSVELKQR